VNEEDFMSGRLYRVVKRFPWRKGGNPTPEGGWEGGESVAYEPGDTVHMEDQDLKLGMYFYLEALDEAGRAMLEKAKPAFELVTSFNPEQHNAIAWALVRKKLAQGESPIETLAWAIRNGAQLPDDYESHKWIAEAIEGKHEPKRGRGRPGKKQRGDIIPTAVERGIAETYTKWLDAFKRDRELAWLRYEALRLREEQPDAAVWRRRLHMEEARKSFKAALTALGARPCPPAARGAKTPRELAQEATVQERGAVWESQTGKPLKPGIVARIVTSARAKKSK
jgi:hypothetical protein